MEIIKQAEENSPSHKATDEQGKKEEPENQRGPSSLISKLGECNKKCEEYLNNWKRAQADFENYKKDEAERIGTFIKYVREDIILNILPILDNIELAEKQLPEKLKKGEGNPQAVEWTKGFLQIKNQIKEFLIKEGIEEIKTVGEKFDPGTMEVIEDIEGGESGRVVEELQKGYIMDGKVIRPAKIKVTK